MSDRAGLLALIAANAYVFLFNLSWGPVMWIMLGEMFPNQIRGSGLAVAGLAQWVANFLVTATFPVLQIGRASCRESRKILVWPDIPKEVRIITLQTGGL